MSDCKINVVLLHAQPTRTAAVLDRGGYTVRRTSDTAEAIRTLLACRDVACVADLPLVEAGQFVQALRRAGIDPSRVVIISLFAGAFDVIAWRGRVVSPRDGDDELISSVDRACVRSVNDRPRLVSVASYPAAAIATRHLDQPFALGRSA